MSAHTNAAKLTITSSTDAAQIVAAQGAGLAIYVHTLTAHNSSATDTSLDVYSGANQLLEAISVPAGAGFVLPLSKPLRLNHNEALKVATNDSVDSVYVNVLYDVKI